MGRPPIHLADDLAEALERLAHAQNTDPDARANEALREWLNEAAEVARKVEAGIADADAGHVVAHERVREWVESWGTDQELPTLAPKTPQMERLLVQTLQFEAALPGMMAEHAGRWAVWFDGLRSVQDSWQTASDWAARNLPADSGCVVARVAERKPLSISGIAAFKLPP